MFYHNYIAMKNRTKSCKIVKDPETYPKNVSKNIFFKYQFKLLEKRKH